MKQMSAVHFFRNLRLRLFSSSHFSCLFLLNSNRLTFFLFLFFIFFYQNHQLYWNQLMRKLNTNTRHLGGIQWLTGEDNSKLCNPIRCTFQFIPLTFSVRFINPVSSSAGPKTITSHCSCWQYRWWNWWCRCCRRIYTHTQMDTYHINMYATYLISFAVLKKKLDK